jgi:hypothetical protein
MPADVKKFFIVLGSFLLISAIAFTAIGAYVYRCGVLVVDVKEGEDGSAIHMRIPAALVHAGLNVLPDEVFEDAAAEIRQFGPLMRAVCDELAAAPDFVLVDVRDGDDEAVRIRKHEGKLEINVRDHEDRVQVVVPLRMVRLVVNRLEAATRSA